MMDLILYLISVSALSTVSSFSTERQYHFIYDLKNWTEAQSYCREHYTDLVTVDSLNMVTMLNGMSRMGSVTDAWIGLHFDLISWKWSLSDESFYFGDGSFRNWASYEPNSAWFTAQCAHMYDNGKWNDAPCQWLYGFICAKTSGQSATFFYISTLMNWTDAQTYCRQHYTDLASIRSLQENEQIRLTKPAGLIVWIGLYRDTWSWSNGNLYLFHYWASGQPHGGIQNCTTTAFSLAGQWQDRECYDKHASICYYDVQLTKQAVKVRLVGNSALDLNDPAILENLLQELKQKVEDQVGTPHVKLSWRKQPDGKIFHKEKQEDHN